MMNYIYKYNRKFLVLFIFAMILSSNCYGQTPEDGISLFKNGEYSGAIQIWVKLSEKGDSEAQFYLGMMNRDGLGVPQDYVQAAKWFQLSAEQNNPNAQHSLGVLYAKGDGVSQDFNKAYNMYRLAAEQGLPVAQSNLGYYFDKGVGVAQDNNAAFRWYYLAAEQGFSEGQYNLGNCYLFGNGTSADNVKAYAWFLLAAEGEAMAGAINNMERMESLGMVTVEQIEQAKKLANTFTEKITSKLNQDN